MTTALSYTTSGDTTAQGSRIAIAGPYVPLSGNALTSLALLLHELTTNAAKYGALSSPIGRLTIDIIAREDILYVAWEERGPTPEPTLSEGFGTTLEKAVLRAMGGTISREWKSDGLSLLLKVPLASLAL